MPQHFDDLPIEPDFINTATALADLNDGNGRRRLDEIFSEANEEIEAAHLIVAAIAAMMKSENGIRDEQL
jgi:hypothetical protein